MADSNAVTSAQAADAAIDNGTSSDEDTNMEHNEMDTTNYEDEEDDSQKPERKNIDTVRKLFPDYHVSFGDGGEADLDYPVYCLYDENGPYSSEELRKRLSSQLRAVDKLRQDVQPNGIVHDIVDPSLHGRVLSDDEVATEIDRLDAKKKETYGENISDELEFDDLDEEESDRYRQQGRRGKEEYEEVKKKRGRFQWVPSVVRCTYSSSTNEPQGDTKMNSQEKPTPKEQNKWTARFQSPIAGVPERRFANQFYEDVEAVLSSMLPMFLKLGILKKGEQDGNQQQVDLQIVTKVQEYQIPPKAKYTGRWHTEGFTERIKAAGVYYIDTGIGMGGGGNLIFRPPSTPGNGYDSNVHTYQPRDETAFCAANPFGRTGWRQMDFVNKRDHHPDDEEIDYAKGHSRETIAKLIIDEVKKASSNSTNSKNMDLQSSIKDAVVKRIIEEASAEPDSNKKPRADTVVALAENGPNDNDNGLDRDDHLKVELFDVLVPIILMELKTESLIRNSNIERGRDHHLENVNSFHRYEKTLEVCNGTAVAFSNTIPHRFNTIHGGHWGKRRLFINFFVVDPDDPLPITTANAASPVQIRSLLLRKGFLDGDTDVAQLVTSFLGGYSHGDLLHRTVVRDQARAAMSEGRQHWKVQYFGNAGFLQFFPDARWNDQYWDTKSIGVKGRNYEHSAKSTELGSGM